VGPISDMDAVIKKKSPVGNRTTVVQTVARLYTELSRIRRGGAMIIGTLRKEVN
jgi:hypothetical protein